MGFEFIKKMGDAGDFSIHRGFEATAAQNARGLIQFPT